MAHVGPKGKNSPEPMVLSLSLFQNGDQKKSKLKVKILCNDKYKTVVPNPSLPMYHFSISTGEHVPLKFLMTKYLTMTNRYILTISCILVNNIHWHVHKYLEINDIYIH